jgi:hypothetical protein
MTRPAVTPSWRRRYEDYLVWLARTTDCVGRRFAVPEMPWAPRTAADPHVSTVVADALRSVSWGG